ncbi:SPOR domain-containing protein, partial [Marinobacter sp. UBA5687]
EPEPEPEFVPANPVKFVALEQLRQRKGWTLQLVAGNQEQTVLNVLRRALEDANLSYTKGERLGLPWFMLVYGQYSSREEAGAAAASLPDALRISNPWIRPYEDY